MNNQKLCGVLFVLLLIAPVASSWGQASDAGRYFERGEEGWFWYEPEPEPAPEPTIDDTPLAAEPVPKPGPTESTVVEEIDPVDPTPLSTAWFRANLDDYRDPALDDPSPANVEAYLYLQRIALERAGSFAEASAAATVKDPWLDANSERPIATYAAQVDRRPGRDGAHDRAVRAGERRRHPVFLSSGLPALRQPGGRPETRQRRPWLRGHGGFPGWLTAVRRPGNAPRR